MNQNQKDQLCKFIQFDGSETLSQSDVHDGSEITIQSSNPNIRYIARFGNDNNLSNLTKIEDFDDFDATMEQNEMKSLPNDSVLITFDLSLHPSDTQSSSNLPLVCPKNSNIDSIDKHLRLTMMDHKELKAFLFSRDTPGVPTHVVPGLVDIEKRKIYFGKAFVYSYPDALAFRISHDGSDVEVFLSYDEIETTLFDAFHDDDFFVSTMMHTTPFGWNHMNCKNEFQKIIQQFDL